MARATTVTIIEDIGPNNLCELCIQHTIAAAAAAAADSVSVMMLWLDTVCPITINLTSFNENLLNYVRTTSALSFMHRFTSIHLLFNRENQVHTVNVCILFNSACTLHVHVYTCYKGTWNTQAKIALHNSMIEFQSISISLDHLSHHPLAR